MGPFLMQYTSLSNKSIAYAVSADLQVLIFHTLGSGFNPWMLLNVNIRIKAGQLGMLKNTVPKLLT